MAPNPFQWLRGKNSYTQDRVSWCRRWERERIKKVPKILGLRDQIKKAAPLIQNQMNVSGTFVKQTCHYLSQFEEVSVSSHTWACNRVIYSCQSTVLTNAGPRFHVINSFIYNDCVAINSLVHGVQPKAQCCAARAGGMCELGGKVRVSLFLADPLWEALARAFHPLPQCPFWNEELCHIVFPGDCRGHSIN